VLFSTFSPSNYAARCHSAPATTPTMSRVRPDARDRRSNNGLSWATAPLCQPQREREQA
jgi:hypothetical protein